MFEALYISCRALHIILHFCRIFFHITAIYLTVKGEEVAVQDEANALQQAGIDALALEDIIHVGAVTVQFVGKPGHTSLLTLQLRLDFFTDMYLLCQITDFNANPCFYRNVNY